MHISFVDIQNYRRLKEVRIDFSETQTLLVGANNSGKTSAMDALISFMTEKSTIHTIDFTITNWTTINSIGDAWENLTEIDEDRLVDIERWRKVLPTLDLWFEVSKKEIHRVSHFLPTLSWRGGSVGLRLSFEPDDIKKLQAEYLEKINAKKETLSAADEKKHEEINLWPANLHDFLDRRLNNYFKIKFYTLNPALIKDAEGKLCPPQQIGSGKQALDANPLKGLVRVNPINAQRGFTDANEGGDDTPESSNKKLSRQLSSYYKKHLNPEDTPTPEDLEAILKLHEAKKIHDEILQGQFKEVTEELNNLGYPGVDNPEILLKTLMNPVDALQHDTAVQYKLPSSDGETYSLPETYNGLGYQNLIYMFFKLKGFRDEWLRLGKSKNDSDDDALFEPIHLVLIEEPEAHLHAQVQQVFIREAFKLLNNHPDIKKSSYLNTQMVVSTHSTHIAHETEFKDLRYFRRIPSVASGIGIPISVVENMTEVFGSEDETAKFVTRYLKATHCDLFFADAVILVEGAAERMMLPQLIDNDFSALKQKYISILEIHGAHAHKLKPLIEKMHLSTLIITDLDANKENDQGNMVGVVPKRKSDQKTNNDTLKSWLPKVDDIDTLLDLEHDKKILTVDTQQSICVAYQKPIALDLVKLKGEAIANTFEDSLVYTNTVYFLDTEELGFFKKAKGILSTSNDLSGMHEEMHDAVRNMEKAKFSLDLLYADVSKKIEVPEYISEGLKWLLDTLEGDAEAKNGST
ncbi:MAG: ATP-dependent endonuclease [Alphaproteobacteria bacterium]|nr:MAG: ATP-dependent endonuclease [Alphaproteobacteria bacterium]